MRERNSLSPGDLNRFQVALRRAPVVLFAQDRDLRYTWVYNPAFATEGDVLGKTDADLLPPTSAALLTEIKAGVLRTGAGVRREVRLETPAGVKQYDLTVEPTRDADGLVTGVACAALDVTERVEAEAARREGEERLRLAQDAAGIGIHDYNVATGHIRWDQRVRELWGVGPDEPVTYDLFMAGLHPDDRAPTQAAVDRALSPAGDGRYYAEYRVTSRRDGAERWVVATGDVTFCDGRPVRLVGTVHDVTDRKRAEAALRESERRFRLAMEAAATGLWTWDLATDAVTWSEEAYAIHGLRAGEFDGTEAGFFRLVHPDDVGRVRAAVRTAVEGRGRYESEFRIVRPDGAVRWVANLGRATYDGDGRPVSVIGTITDITARRQVEERLRASEERFRLAADAVNGIIYEYDPRTGHVERSRGLYEVLGYRPDEVPPAADWWQEQMHPDDRPVAAKLPAAAGPDRSTTEYRVRHRDGRWLHVEDRAVVVRGAAGEVARLVGCTVDITDRKRAEEALREADRRKDEFLATLAHELRNPLAPIRNAVQVLMAKGPPDPCLVWARELIDRQVRVMTRLVDDLLDVSRVSRGKLELRKERVELAAVVAAAVEISRPLIDSAGHELVVALPAQPVVLDGDPVRLAQVFANLLNNAAKYTNPNGHIRLTAERSGDGVAVAVADDGIGIAADMRPRLFEIFAQAEPALERAQGGLGIGLSLVRGLVELHGGTIEAHSDGPGRGSTFTVRLPTAGPVPSGPPAPAAAHEQPCASRCRLLIADDLVDSADSLAMLLQLMGHEARTAYDGEQAVAVAGEFRPDVVLLDLGMPKVSGLDACRRIRQQPWGRQMCLVAVTGWGQDEDRRRTAAAGFDHHLVKPVGPADLEKLLGLFAAAPEPAATADGRGR